MAIVLLAMSISLACMVIINHLRKLGYLKITYKYINNVLQRQIAPVLYESERGNYE